MIYLYRYHPSFNKNPRFILFDESLGKAVWSNDGNDGIDEEEDNHRWKRCEFETEDDTLLAVFGDYFDVVEQIENTTGECYV